MKWLKYWRAVEMSSCKWLFIEPCSKARLKWGLGMRFILFCYISASQDVEWCHDLSPCRSCCVKPPHSFRYSSRPVWHWRCVGGRALWRRWRLRDSSCLQVGGPTLLSSYCNHSCLPSLHLPPSSFLPSLPLPPPLLSSSQVRGPRRSEVKPRTLC